AGDGGVGCSGKRRAGRRGGGNLSRRTVGRLCDPGRAAPPRDRRRPRLQGDPARMTAPTLTDLSPIPDAEHAERTQAVRSALADRRLDVLLAYGAHRDYRPGDLRWLARWYCVVEETAGGVLPPAGPTTPPPPASSTLPRATP